MPPFLRTESSDIPGFGFICEALVPEVSSAALEILTPCIRGPFWETESTDIPGPGFICKIFASGILLKQAALLQ